MVQKSSSSNECNVRIAQKEGGFSARKSCPRQGARRGARFNARKRTFCQETSLRKRDYPFRMRMFHS